MKQRLPILMSTVALAVAILGWTSLGEAARSLVIPKASVGTVQLKTGAVTAPKIRSAAVGTVKLKAGAVTLAKLAPSARIPGPKGDKGDKGDAGAMGHPGISAWQRVEVESASDSFSSKTVIASCPAGKRVLGGGAEIVPATAFGPALIGNGPDGDTGWRGQGREIVGTLNNWRVRVEVICATVGS